MRTLIAIIVAALAAPLAAQPRRPATLPAGARIERDLEYARAPGDISLKLDLYLPASDRALPLVIFVHGGGWRQGSKNSVPILSLLSHGYAVASIDYRLTDVAPFPAQIHDCKAAVRFLRAHADDFGFDAKRFGAWGSSAGGHLVALLGTGGDVAALEGNLGNAGVSSRVQAVIDCWGPSDLSRMGDRGNGASAVAALLGGPPSEKRELAALASPVSHVTPDDPPFLIAHGEKDALVPVAQGKLVHEALRKAGAKSELRVAAAAGHGWQAAPPIEVSIAFLDSVLKP